MKTATAAPVVPAEVVAATADHRRLLDRRRQLPADPRDWTAADFSAWASAAADHHDHGCGG